MIGVVQLFPLQILSFEHSESILHPANEQDGTFEIGNHIQVNIYIIL